MFFPVVKSHLVSPVAKTFNHRMRSFSHVCIVPWLPYACSSPWKNLGFCILLGVYWSAICQPWVRKHIVLFSGKSLEFGSKNLYEPCKGVHCSDLTSLQQGKLSTDILMWTCYQVGKVSVVSHITTAPGPPDSPREPDTVCRSAAAINVSWEVSKVLCFQLLNLQSCKMRQILCVKKLSQTLQSAAMTFLSFLLKSASIFILFT